MRSSSSPSEEAVEPTSSDGSVDVQDVPFCPSADAPNGLSPPDDNPHELFDQEDAGLAKFANEQNSGHNSDTTPPASNAASVTPTGQPASRESSQELDEATRSPRKRSRDRVEYSEPDTQDSPELVYYSNDTAKEEIRPSESQEFPRSDLLSGKLATSGNANH